MSANKRFFLVAVDGSLDSSKVAERAAELAHYERQDRIVLLSVAHPKEKDDPQVVPLSSCRFSDGFAAHVHFGRLEEKLAVDLQGPAISI
jgi:hypothetical protein